MATAKRTHQTVHEKRLFHGTCPDAVEAICKQNFDWRLHGKNATMYGEGSYFAVNASYSHAYAKRDIHSSQFMFLAKVLVGSYTTGHSSYRRPPPKNPSDPASDLYDSCVDNQANPTIFIVFDTDQLYPEYIIQYSTMPQTALATASYALPQPSTAPSRPKPVSSLPQKGNLKHPTRSSTTALPQSSTAPSRPKPPSSQQQKGNLKHPARSSNTVTTSNPNRSTTQSSYFSTTTGATVHQPKTSIAVVLATTSNAPVSRRGHSSIASRANPSRRSTPMDIAFDASGSSAQSGYPSTVHQASASNTNYATPSYSTSSFYSSTSRDVSLVPPYTPKKKKGCLIM